MAEPNKILSKMLDRLLAGLVNGPGLNCRPHASRQRIDWVQLTKLGDISPEQALRDLLGKSGRATIRAAVPMPKSAGGGKLKRLKVADAIDAADENGLPMDEGLADESPSDGSTPDRAWIEQGAVLKKLHTIAEDARTYEQDTGVSVLNIGFPLLSLPPGAFGGGGSSATCRVLAPLAFIPVSITVKRGAAPAIELQCKGEGVDRISPNTALFAWLEQQTGKPVIERDEGENGTHPWKEIAGIVGAVCETLNLAVPELFRAVLKADKPDSTPTGDALKERVTPVSDESEPGSSGGADEPTIRDEHESLPDASVDDGRANVAPSPSRENSPVPTVLEDESSKNEAQESETTSHRAAADDSPIPLDLHLQFAPRPDESGETARILCGGVLGLFPMANQGLLRDTQTLLAADTLTGPIESFIRLGVNLDVATPAPHDFARDVPRQGAKPVVTAEERFISGSDPCQARAVRLARECSGLVVHGPPGTGKSQTITNIIGDHLARGQRVLVVCDKRTALDVVYNRLNHLGLGSLCAVFTIRGATSASCTGRSASSWTTCTKRRPTPRRMQSSPRLTRNYNHCMTSFGNTATRWRAARLPTG